jgi:uncharacterized protein (TIGR04255 family)
LPLDREDRPRLTFGTNPLKVVVAQMRFPPIFALEQANGIAPVQVALRDEFPIAEDRRHQLNVALGPGGMENLPGAWRFMTEDLTWIAAVSTDFISLETTSYERFEPFRERFAWLVDRIATVLEIRRQVRLGLRYINEIAVPGVLSIEDFRGYVSADLMGMAAHPLIAPFVTGSLQQIKLELTEGNVTMNHGYGRQGVAGGYVIDIDCYNDRPQPFELPAAIDLLDTFKRWSWTLFRDSVTEDLVRRLDGHPLHEETA